ncbi:MAG: SDR family NAD(P)-dependent oxidoreductase [Ginsengibacter sp.]
MARGKDGLEAATKEVEEEDGEAIIAIADVSDSIAVEKAAELIESKLGPIDVWVNNAMVSVIRALKENECGGV